LDVERKTTAAIQKIKNESATKQIGKVEWFADKYMEEQVEEERKFLNHKNRMDVVGKDGHIIMHMDKQFLEDFKA
jgi:ferritin